jgi:hypothetical protein
MDGPRGNINAWPGLNSAGETEKLSLNIVDNQQYLHAYFNIF